jgi:hypothetical protein
VNRVCTQAYSSTISPDRPLIAARARLRDHRRMKVAEALHELGVRPDTLDDGERERLATDGVLELERLLPPEQVARLLALVDPQPHPSGTRHIQGLATRHPELACLWCHPRVLAAVSCVVGPEPHVLDVAYRGPAPGFGAQVLHVDWSAVPVGAEFPVCNAFLALVDFTGDNGATRVVPGSHRCGKTPQSYTDPRQRHPAERPLVGPAGTVFVFNGHVWHSGTLNRSGAIRHSLQVAVRRRRGFAAYVEERVLPDWLTPAARALLAP